MNDEARSRNAEARAPSLARATLTRASEEENYLREVSSGKIISESLREVLLMETSIGPGHCGCTDSTIDDVLAIASELAHWQAENNSQFMHEDL